MIKRILKRTQEDKGNAVIILGIMLLMVLMLVGGLLLDVSKAHQLKSSYVDAAKKATQAAIMEQDTRGYLKPEAAAEAVRVYETIIRPSVVNPDGYFSKCEEYGDNDVNLTAVFYKADKRGPEFSVRRSQMKGLSPDERTARSQIAESMRITSSAKKSIYDGKYDSIQLEVTEGTENAILPGSFGLTQADDESKANIKCQQMKIAGKANIFVGDKDGQFN